MWSSRQRPQHRFNVYVSMIKIDTDGLCAIQEQDFWRHHVKMQINKNTTTSYATQRERDGGMISQGIGRGETFKPLSQWGKAKCQRENP